jgi:uncharacterized protein
MRQNALIFFMKTPVMGRVKTRLAEGIGNKHATTLYRLMCEYLLNLTAPQNTDIIVAYDDEERTALPAYLEGKALLYQSGDALGARMKNAFEAVFEKGYTRAILVGSDIPDVDERIVEEAFAHLCNHDAILSPTEDGGYYLIGFHAHTFCKEAFEGITYSQSDVYANTLLKLSPLRVAKGEMLCDIDTLEDLRAFTCNEKQTPLWKFAQSMLSELPRISVIIPVYHEDVTLLHTLSHLKAMAHAQNYEIIVVDTHERTTVERLHVSAVRVAFSNKGRSTQMNEGARKARGELLLFLHADTLLPYRWDQKIENALHVKKAGAFSLGINSSHLGLFCIETLANLRTHMTKIPYGDQAHFFKASFFRNLGGYAQIALMEDVEIMKRLKKRGHTITLLKSKVLTSPRRWHKEGIFCVTLRNRVLSFLYWVGVSPTHLVKRYKEHRN